MGHRIELRAYKRVYSENRGEEKGNEEMGKRRVDQNDCENVLASGYRQ